MFHAMKIVLSIFFVEREHGRIANASEESGIKQQGAKGKRVLIRGSVPTTHCINKALKNWEPRDRCQWRSKAASVFVLFVFTSCFTNIIALSLAKQRNFRQRIVRYWYPAYGPQQGIPY